MLKLRGREVGSEDRVLFAGQSAVGHQVWQRGWDGGQRRSRGPISLCWDQIEACLSEEHQGYWE